MYSSLKIHKCHRKSSSLSLFKIVTLSFRMWTHPYVRVLHALGVKPRYRPAMGCFVSQKKSERGGELKCTHVSMKNVSKSILTPGITLNRVSVVDDELSRKCIHVR